VPMPMACLFAIACLPLPVLFALVEEMLIAIAQSLQVVTKSR
jgi:hypothetical protein